jgi:hypothetical protein
MKIPAILILLTSSIIHLQAQELFPSTEPASAMSAKSIGLRINNELFPSNDQAPEAKLNNNATFRLDPEIMWGINKKWMMHVNFYASNMHQSNYKFEGSGIYLKYRFYSSDQVQSHFRLALYGRASLIDNPIQPAEVNLAGDNSGFGTGLIATQLLHKVAISFTGGYIKGLDNVHDRILRGQGTDQVNYSLSAGYLLLPFKYKSYNQPNLNVYVEFLGRSNASDGSYYLDAAPGLQLILNSLIRIDLLYQKQVLGHMLRNNSQMIELRFEYNFLNAYQ